MRVIVTGSRTWSDTETIRRALCEIADGYPHDWNDQGIVLVHGGCNTNNGRATHSPPRGADAIANALWKSWGMTVEIHKAKWSQHGRAAGPIRNKDMVDRGADLCIAFILDESAGATDCVRRATEAGIPVHVYRLTSEGGSLDHAGNTAQRGSRRRRQGVVRGNRGNRAGHPGRDRTNIGA